VTWLDYHMTFVGSMLGEFSYSCEMWG